MTSTPDTQKATLDQIRKAQENVKTAERQLDILIIKAITEGDISYADLSEATGISSSTLRYRYRNLTLTQVIH